MAKYPVTMDTARAALAHIESTDRALWVKMGQALKSEFGEDGLELFDQWSETAANYDENAVKATWRGFKAAGRVTIGSLIYEAKQRGFDPKEQASNAQSTETSPEARAKRAEARRVADEKATAELTATHQACAQKAAALWDGAVLESESPYLGVKGVGAHAVRFEGVGKDATVLVPLRDLAGRLWNVQRIKPDGAKLFMKSARVSGLHHLIGTVDAQGCLIGAIDPHGWLLVAEGYATAATLYEALGGVVAVAFNAGNLKPVCEALRAHYPTIKILICADNDQGTEQRTGTNGGIKAAQDAARAVGGYVVHPQGLPLDQSDFNDLYHLSGLSEVKGQVKAAMESSVMLNDHVSPPSQTQAPETIKQKNAGSGRGSDGRFKGNAGGSYEVNDNGVFYHGFDKESKPRPPMMICSPLRVTARTRDENENDWGYLLEFTDPLNNPKFWAMPSRLLAGDGAAYRENLLSMGLRIESGNEAKNLLSRYIQSSKTDVNARCTERVGWFGDAFVLPDEVIGNADDERVIFQAGSVTKSPFVQAGALEDWVEYIAAPCAGNTRMVFAISCAFAGVLVEPAGVQSGGFHFVGDGSIGKSTALFVASSVFGARNYLRTWRATDTALEATAAQHSDTLLVLDEISEVDPRVLGDIVYMLGNEQGKGRGLRTGGVRPTLTWRLLYLSTGEKRVSDIVKEAGKTIKAGQETRLVNLKGDAGQGLGIFDTLNGFTGGHELAKHLNDSTRQYYGVAGHRFIEHVVSQIEPLRERLRYDVQNLAHEWTPSGAHGQVHRVAQRFALVALAGEMATRAGLTGWTDGEAKRAARACFDSWIEERGGAGNSETIAILEQVRGWFGANGDARLMWWHRAGDDHRPSTSNMAGYKRLVRNGVTVDRGAEMLRDGEFNERDCELRYYVMPEVFKNEICKGYNHKAVAKLLLDRGIIIGDGHSYMRPERLPLIGNNRCYRFTPALFEEN